MTHPFLYHRAASRDAATQELAAPGAAPLGGGTDLLVAIGEEITRPDVLVDLRYLPDGRAVSERSDGVRIGSAISISELARHELVRGRYPALAEACEVARARQRLH